MRMALEPEALDERERLREAHEQGDRPPRAATLYRGSEIGERGGLGTLFHGISSKIGQLSSARGNCHSCAETTFGCRFSLNFSSRHALAWCFVLVSYGWSGSWVRRSPGRLWAAIRVARLIGRVPGAAWDRSRVGGDNGCRVVVTEVQAAVGSAVGSL